MKQGLVASFITLIMNSDMCINLSSYVPSIFITKYGPLVNFM